MRLEYRGIRWSAIPFDQNGYTKASGRPSVSCAGRRATREVLMPARMVIGKPGLGPYSSHCGNARSAYSFGIAEEAFIVDHGPGGIARELPPGLSRL
jgi:hypothetical protein